MRPIPRLARHAGAPAGLLVSFGLALGMVFCLALCLASCAGNPTGGSDGPAGSHDDLTGGMSMPDGPANNPDLFSPDLCATTCGGVCVDEQNDPMNCGACGKTCPPTDMCVAGQCSSGMAPPTIYCNSTPPAGSRQPATPPKYSGGTCPMLMAGENTVMSHGHKRTFQLVLPQGLMPSETLPVVFLWYWLRGSSSDFIQKGDVQNAVDTQRFVAVVPDAKGDLFWNWPFAITDSTLRQAEEYNFFDDMLSCVEEQFNVNKNCVATAGVSAGALFTDQLAGDRSQYLSSGLSLSGGVGMPNDGLVRTWANPPHALPMMVLWGGPKDICIVINFQTASHNLEDDLDADGNFFLECIHNCGHGEPPFTAPPGLSTFAGLWRFVFDHPFWLAKGDSPYKKTGIPPNVGYPPWCGIGKGSAVPRTGMCPPPGC